jgi:hypothetical protein
MVSNVFPAVIPDNWKVKIRKILVQSQPGQKVGKTLKVNQ